MTKQLSHRETVVIQPGDVIDVPVGIHRVVERFVVHGVTRYPGGAQSLRARYASNPRGIDWSVFVDPGEPLLRLISRGVAAVDSHPRALLPS